MANATASENGALDTASRLIRRAAGGENTQCVIRVLNVELTTSSFAMYTFSHAVFIQALVLVSCSSVADHGTAAK